MKRFFVPLLLLIASPSFADTCLVNTSPPTYAVGQNAQQQCDPNGNLKTTGSVTVNPGSASNASDGQATSSTNGQNLSFPYLWNGSTFDRWRGDTTLGAWVNIKNASIAVTGTFWQATQPVSLTSVPLPTGAATAANQTTANTSLSSIDTKVTNAGTPSLTAIATSGGVASASRIPSSAASTNATSAKASAGRVYKIVGYNNSGAVKRIKFYNKASAPTVGTDTIVFSRPLPPGAFSFDWADIGFYFSTGIAYALTGGSADNDTTALASGDITDLNVEYN